MFDKIQLSKENNINSATLEGTGQLTMAETFSGSAERMCPKQQTEDLRSLHLKPFNLKP